MILKGEGAISESDFVKAQFVRMRPRPIFAVIGLIIFALFVWTLLVSPTIKGVLILIALLTLFAVLFPLTWIRMYRRQAVQSDQTIEVDDMGVSVGISTMGTTTQFHWSDFHRWRKSSGLVLLYDTPRTCLIVPSHFFSDDRSFNKLVQTLHEKIGKAT